MRGGAERTCRPTNQHSNRPAIGQPRPEPCDCHSDEHQQPYKCLLGMPLRRGPPQPRLEGVNADLDSINQSTRPRRNQAARTKAKTEGTMESAERENRRPEIRFCLGNQRPQVATIRKLGNRAATHVPRWFQPLSSPLSSRQHREFPFG